MNTPTPETDKRIGIISNGSNVVDASWARQLERERDQARATNLELATDANSITLAESLHKMESERDQLRKVCDELENALMRQLPITAELGEVKWDAINLYNSLPHVIAAKKGNEV